MNEHLSADPITHSETMGVDAQQSEAIRQLRRKVTLAWATALFGPVLAFAGVAFSGLQWRAADRQLEVMRTQLKDAREGAEAARRDTERALALAANQAVSLHALAQAATVSAESEQRQFRVMERQAQLMAEQLVDSRSAAAESARLVADQLRIAESQAASMQYLAEATGITAEAAKLSSDHAERSVATLRETLHVQERAWIRFADLHETQFHIPFLLPYRLTLEFNNAGRTPARNLRVALVRERSEKPYGVDSFVAQGYSSIVGPGEKFFIEPVYFSYSSTAESKGRLAAHIYGYITYDDIFDAHHRLDICYVRGRDGSWGACAEDVASSRAKRD